MHQAITAAWRRLRHFFDMSVVNTDNNKREMEREREGKRSEFIPSGASSKGLDRVTKWAWLGLI